VRKKKRKRSGEKPDLKQRLAVFSLPMYWKKKRVVKWTDNLIDYMNGLRKNPINRKTKKVGSPRKKQLKDHNRPILANKKGEDR